MGLPLWERNVAVPELSNLVNPRLSFFHPFQATRARLQMADQLVVRVELAHRKHIDHFVAEVFAHGGKGLFIAGDHGSGPNVTPKSLNQTPVFSNKEADNKSFVSPWQQRFADAKPTCTSSIHKERHN